MAMILIDSRDGRHTLRHGAGEVWETALVLDEPPGARSLPGGRLGVRLEPDQDPASLTPFMDRLDFVEIVWRTFTDGRGFSQAHQLRRLGYEGRLCASGDVLADQIAFLVRCGFDAIDFDPGRGDALTVAGAALEQIPVVYQSAFDQRRTAAQSRALQDTPLRPKSAR